MQSRSMIPSQWMHPDMRRQVQEKERVAVARRIEWLEGCVQDAADRTQRAHALLKERKYQMQRVRLTLEQLASEVDDLERKYSLAHSLTEGLESQYHYQKGISGTSERPTSSMQTFLREVTQVDEEAEDDSLRACPLELHFLHLFQHPVGLHLQANHDSNTSRAFLRRYAPLFEWDDQNGRVCPPFFFDEPCMMDAEGNPCRNTACAFWHLDQIDHLKKSLRRLTDSMQAISVRDHRLCVVSRFVLTFMRIIKDSTSLDVLCTRVATVLGVMIGLGWHRVVLSGGEQVWLAPTASVPSPTADTTVRIDLFRNAEEREIWTAINDSAQPGMAAIRRFRECPDALSWRCLMRVMGQSVEQRLWLAERGAAVFPTSPHIRLQHVIAQLEYGRPLKDCMRACLDAAKDLSTQAAAASISDPDTACATCFARHVAYMIAKYAILISQKDTACGIALLETVIEQRGAICLLPIAHTNLTMLLIALKQCGHGMNADFLPLGSISDHLLTFSTAFPTRPQDFCGQLLNGQLELISACQKDHLDPVLLDKMRSSTQLALMRAFSVGLQYVEKIVQKSSTTSEVCQSTLWWEYIRFVGELDSSESELRVVETVVQTCDGTCSCLLSLLLVWYLESQGRDVTGIVQRCCTAFSERHSIDISTSSLREYITSEPSWDMLPSVEWVAFFLLWMQRYTPVEQADCMDTVPATLQINDADAVILLLMAKVRLAAQGADLHAFRRALTSSLYVLREPHLLWWSPLDAGFENMVGLPHTVLLFIYSIVPVLLGPVTDRALEWRSVALHVGEQLGVLHPLLRTADGHDSAA